MTRFSKLLIDIEANESIEPEKEMPSDAGMEQADNESINEADVAAPLNEMAELTIEDIEKEY